jgi:hypothetical protein
MRSEHFCSALTQGSVPPDCTELIATQLARASYHPCVGSEPSAVSANRFVAQVTFLTVDAGSLAPYPSALSSPLQQVQQSNHAL